MEAAAAAAVTGAGGSTTCGLVVTYNQTAYDMVHVDKVIWYRRLRGLSCQM